MQATEKDSTDNGDSPTRSPQTPRCESTQGGSLEEEARELEITAESDGAEVTQERGPAEYSWEIRKYGVPRR